MIRQVRGRIRENHSRLLATLTNIVLQLYSWDLSIIWNDSLWFKSTTAKYFEQIRNWPERKVKFSHSHFHILHLHSRESESKSSHFHFHIYQFHFHQELKYVEIPNPPIFSFNLNSAQVQEKENPNPPTFTFIFFNSTSIQNSSRNSKFSNFELPDCLPGCRPTILPSRTIQGLNLSLIANSNACYIIIIKLVVYRGLIRPINLFW